MTNKEYIINLLLDELQEEKDFKRVSIDDGFSSYEAMLYYNIQCPYYAGDKRRHCISQKSGVIERKGCYECKEEWLNSEVEQ